MDLRAAAHEISGPGLWADIVFHAQQAAEKAFKAFLAWHDLPFGKTHSLQALGRECAVLDAKLSTAARQAAPLTEYAWKFRYPGEREEPTREEAEKALATARQVYEAVLSRLPGPCAREQRVFPEINLHHP
jgi:HEPN domain-containing protein